MPQVFFNVVGYFKLTLFSKHMLAYKMKIIRRKPP